MTNSIESYIDFSKNFADNHSEICDFVYGKSRKILSKQRSEIEYPVLWLDIPDVDVDLNDEDCTIFRGSFIALTNVSNDDDCHEQEQEELTFKIMLQLVTRIINMHKTGQIQLLNKNLTLEPCSSWSTDDDTGWRVDFAIKGEPLCFDDDVTQGVWNDLNVAAAVTDSFGVAVSDSFGVVVAAKK